MKMSGKSLKRLNRNLENKENLGLVQTKLVPASSSKNINQQENNVLQTTQPVFKSKENTLKSQLDKKKYEKFYNKGSGFSKDKKWKIFDETAKTLKNHKSVFTQTDDGKELVCSDKPSEKYWELLAEERRLALSASLEENKKLADEITTRDCLIEDLKTEIEQLEEVASHNDYLTSVIQQLLNSADNEQADDVHPAPTNSTHHTSEDEVSTSMNRIDGSKELKDNNFVSSDGSCSHDSDKENKPPSGYLK